MSCSQNVNGTIVAGFFCSHDFNRGAKNEPRNQFYFYKSNLAAKQQFFVQREHYEWGTGDPGYSINAEFNDHSHVRGVISMARSNDPNSAGSQFFICHGSPTQLDHQYTTFGKLIKGEDVLEKIATTPTHPQDRPDKRMEIISIKIVPASSVE